ncbi:H(+)/Cl(-) exchange transporter isoform X2 [Oopsacas minuta]|uniref:H(+)/Cl(-) exchange transporter isoform X2 n=1 Tax=Oopsacas minuta TaxID=111878 RepID=A0AAV7JS68_9METZ|nr:H(+)/Cl(-) exchange transporter isoform X2 [Oopsacas minuta]
MNTRDRAQHPEGNNWNSQYDYLDSLISGSHTSRHDADGLYYKASLPNMVTYPDFKTFDWNKDEIRDNAENHYDKIGRSGFVSGLLEFLESWWGWILVILMGVCVGIISVFIHCGISWFSSFREGVCRYDLYKNKHDCCWVSEVYSVDSDCEEFLTWREVFGLYSDGYVVGAYNYIFNYLGYITLSAAFATLAATYVKVIAPYAYGSGIPEIKTILSGYVIKGFLGKATLLVKSMGVILCVGAGMSVGMEGPIVHIACCVGNIFASFSRRFRNNEARKRVMLSASVAAGVAVAFIAPIGGVLFSFEELSYYFPVKTLWKALAAAMAGVFTVRYISPTDTHHCSFFLNFDTDWNMFELIPFSMLGVLGAFYGVFFIKCNLFWTRYKATYHFAKYPILETFVLAFITSLLAFPNPFTKAEATQVIKQLTSKCNVGDSGYLCAYNWSSSADSSDPYHDAVASDEVYFGILLLSLAILFKLTTTILTFGSKIPTGLFIPTMYIGACTGRIVGILTEQTIISLQGNGFGEFICPRNNGYQCVTPGLYGIVGSAAFLSGVNRMTVTLAIIMIELTGGLKYIIPILTAVMIAKWLGDCLCTSSIYEEYIQLKKYPFLSDKEEYSANYRVGEVLDIRGGYRGLVWISATESTVICIQELIERYNYWGYPVVLTHDSRLLLGYVTKLDLKQALYEAWANSREIRVDTLVHFVEVRPEQQQFRHILDFSKIVDRAQFQVTRSTPMHNVVKMFQKIGLRQVLVSECGKVEGILSKKDIVEHVLQTSRQYEEDHSCSCWNLSERFSYN